MATLLIRNLPADVDGRLTLEAERNRRSKEKQALFMIESGLRRRRPAAEIIAEAKKIHARCNRPATMEEILQATEGEH